jgi:hypothetical protein
MAQLYLPLGIQKPPLLTVFLRSNTIKPFQGQEGLPGTGFPSQVPMA